MANVSILQHSTGYVLRAGSAGGFGILSHKQTDTLTFTMDGYVSRTLGASASRYLKVVLPRKAAVAAPVSKLASFTRSLSRAWEQSWLAGDETYTSIVENPFIPTHLFPATATALI